MSNQREHNRRKIQITGHSSINNRRSSYYNTSSNNKDFLIDCLRKKKRYSSFILQSHIQGKINTECNQINHNGIILTNQINCSINQIPNDIQFYTKKKIKDPYILTIRDEIKVLKKEIEKKSISISLSNNNSKRKKTNFLSQQYNNSNLLNTIQNKENKYVDINTFTKTTLY